MCLPLLEANPLVFSALPFQAERVLIIKKFSGSVCPRHCCCQSMQAYVTPWLRQLGASDGWPAAVLALTPVGRLRHGRTPSLPWIHSKEFIPDNPYPSVCREQSLEFAVTPLEVAVRCLPVLPSYIFMDSRYHFFIPTAAPYQQRCLVGTVHTYTFQHF